MMCPLRSAKGISSQEMEVAVDVRLLSCSPWGPADGTGKAKEETEAVNWFSRQAKRTDHLHAVTKTHCITYHSTEDIPKVKFHRPIDPKETINL